MLGEFRGDDGIIVADFEAGVGTLSRMEAGQADAFAVVAEPSAKSLEVARWAVDLIEGGSLGQLVVLANRVGIPEDERRIRDAFDGRQVLVIPDDPAIRAADFLGLAPFDTAPSAPAVVALGGVVSLLLG